MSRIPLRLRRLTDAALIAAAYTALTLALAPISFGQIQLRVSEALTLLPVFTPDAVWGVTLGCALSNAVGAMTGANFLGLIDIFTGSLTTLLAALLTRRLRGLRIRGLVLPSSLPPVLLNAVVIGTEWCYALTGALAPASWLLFGVFVAAGELLSCSVLGVLLVRLLETGGAGRYLTGNAGRQR